MPCTTLLVGKLASYDGSTIIARNEDSPNGEFTPKKFTVVSAADQPRAYTSTISHVQVALDGEPMRYTSVPNALDNEGIWAEAGVNEKNVAMSATETLTTNERVLAADPLVEYVPARGVEGQDGYEPARPGGIGEEDFVTLVLPYATSARDGVERLGRLLATYGTYEMNGVAFSDVDEVWWMETVGGHHWIARRVPDDCYVVVPNQLGIDEFDLTDALGEKRDHLCSPDLAEWMDAHFLDLTLDRDRYVAVDADDLGADGADLADVEPADPHRVFNPRDAFGSHDDADHVYNTPRAWSMHRFLNPHMGFELDEVWGPEDNDIPWALPPQRKLTVEDVKYALSLHFQGTPFDPYAAGDDVRRSLYRPIGINRNSQLAVIQLRPYMPESCRALQWMAYGSNPFNALVPLYANIDRTPEYLANTTATVSTDSFYWANRLVAVMADAHFNSCAAHIERYQQAVPSKAMNLVHDTDEKIVAASPDFSAAAPTLEAANDAIAAMLRTETDKLLDRVLFAASMGMKNGFARSDG